MLHAFVSCSVIKLIEEDVVGGNVMVVMFLPLFCVEDSILLHN